METYLNAAIKDVITEFPEVGTILAEYDVGCVTCQVGTCLLKDVVGIHGLSPEAEGALMARIAVAVIPGAPSALAVLPGVEIKGAPPARTSGRRRGSSRTLHRSSSWLTSTCSSSGWSRRCASFSLSWT